MRNPDSGSASKSAVVIGAGLVGSLWSLFLAKKGYSVDLFERRPDMRLQTISAGRSINLAVSVRGLHALDQVGLKDQALRRAIPMRGRMIHASDSSVGFQPYGLSENDCIHSISRAELNQMLMTEAERTGRIKIHFEEEAIAARVATGEVSFKNSRSGRMTEKIAPLIFGTDGSASVLRNAILMAAGGRASEDLLDYGYKELTIPPERSDGMEKHALHIWPRGNRMLIALPNLDGSFTCTLFLPLIGAPSFESLKSCEQVIDFFESEYPDALSKMPSLAEEFFENPTGKMVTVRAPRWHEGSFHLLGDAAHAIVPFFGQGMNCGFEDCTVLSQILDDRKGQPLDWTQISSDFFELRKKNTDAIAQMAIENFEEMRDKVGDSGFLLRKKVEAILQREFPGKYISRYSLVSFSRVPYALALKAGIIQNEILRDLCANLRSELDLDLTWASQLVDNKLSHLMSSVIETQ